MSASGEVRLISGRSGFVYQVEVDPSFESPDGGRYFSVRGEAPLVFKRAKKSSRAAEVESPPRCDLEVLNAGRGALTNQLSTLVDIGYDENGEFSGFFLSFPTKSESLCSFLSKKPSEDVRLRVARNLCVLICSAKKLGTSIGRLRPERIMITSHTCGVFLFDDIAGERAMGLADESFSKVIGEEEPYDVFFHVYAIMQGAAGVQTEQETWCGSTLPYPSRLEMANAILDGRNRPWIVRFLDRILSTDHFSGPFWNEPSWKKALYESYVSTGLGLQGRPCSSPEAVARNLLVELSRSSRMSDRRLFTFATKVKHLIAGGDEKRFEMKKNERRAIGSRGLGQTTVFWSATLGTSIMLGLFSFFNGYSPLDAALYAPGSLMLPDDPSTLRWQYPATSLFGCIFCNIFMTRRDAFRGFERQSYLWSILFAIFFMAAGRLALDALGVGAL